MHSRFAIRCLTAVFALSVVFMLAFGTISTARAEGEPAWQAQITAQIPAEEVAALGGPAQTLADLQTRLDSSVQAFAAQTSLESLGMTADGQYGYRLTLQGAALDSLRAALWNLPQDFSLIGGPAELSLAQAGAGPRTTGAGPRTTGAGELTLILESNPSTGYLWDISTLPEGFARAAEDTFESRAPEGVVGAPELQTVRLTIAPEAAAGALTLRYARSFEPQTEITRSLTINAPLSGTLDLSSPTPQTYDNTMPDLPSVDPATLVSADSLPASFDWRTQKAPGSTASVVPAVRNQGVCGSCYAFGTVGVMEVAMARQADLADLSEQFLVSCTWKMNYGCGGGYPNTHVFHWNKLADKQPQVGSAIGAVRESTFPYTNGGSMTTKACVSIASHPYRLNEFDGWSWVATGVEPWKVHPTDDVLKSAIYTYGPVTASLCAGPNFNKYTGGYFSASDAAYCGSNKTNHEIILVGWQTVGSSTYYILRNSWGTGWGESGYMRIKSGTSNLGLAATLVRYTGAATRVSRLDSYASPSDHSIAESETLRLAVTRLIPVFSKPMNAAEAAVPTSYLLFNASTSSYIPVDRVVYSSSSKLSAVYLNGGAPLPDGEYYFMMYASNFHDINGRLLDGDGDGNPGGDFQRSFIVSRAPAAPTLTGPASGSYLNTSTPTLAWNPVDTALQGYQVQMAADSLFTKSVTLTAAAGPSLTPTLADGLYYWRVRSLNRFGYAGPWSSSRSLRVDTVLPAVPALYSPSEGYTAKGTPTYTWKAASGATYYQLHVWDAADPAAYDYISPWTTALSCKPTVYQPSAADPGKAYQWAVQSKDRAGNLSGWSAPRSLLVRPPTPGIPALLSPASAAYINDSNDLLQWKPVTYAASYWLQISKSSTFAARLVDQSVTGASFDLTAPLPADGKYYWRVRAVNEEGGKGAYSTARSFTLDRTAPIPPLLYTPTEGYTAYGTPTYKWLAAPGAAYYQLHVWDGAGYDYTSPWTTLLYHKPTLLQPAAATTGTAYQWAVQAKDRAGNLSGWSETRSLTVKLPKPGTVLLYSPASGATLTAANDILKWKAAAYTQTYHLQLSRYSTFSSLKLDVDVDGLSYDLSAAVLSDGVYYWRVKAVNAEGVSGSYSAARWFKLDR